MADENFCIRGFEELDEKLPYIAKIIVLRGIEFTKINQTNPDKNVLSSIFAIMKEHLLCVSEMTADELDDAFGRLIFACELVCLVNDGTIIEGKTGEYQITPRGRSKKKRKHSAA